jgi:hypothetical protein
LKITLDKTYQKNQDYTVYIKYTARPNEVKQEGSAAINDAKGLYFINAQEQIRINQHKSGHREKQNLLQPGFLPLINPTRKQLRKFI